MEKDGFVIEEDEFVIHLDVAGRTYPVKIKKGNEQEEFVIRQAVKRIQQHVIQFRQFYVKSVDDRDLLAMAAIQLAIDMVSLEEQIDTKPFTQKIQQLTKMLENYLPDK